ncbi:MAG: hypothetical protein AAGE80_15945 [Pseudomonadota bacterium]
MRHILIAGTMLLMTTSAALATGAGEPLGEFKGKGLFSSLFSDERADEEKSSQPEQAKDGEEGETR